MNLFSAGIKKVLLYYIIGFSVVLIFHFSVGWNYTYAPPLSAVLFALLLICGLPWAMLNLTGLVKSSNRQQALGELTIHFIVYSASISLIFFNIRNLA
jgi:hypothetical protein